MGPLLHIVYFALKYISLVSIVNKIKTQPVFLLLIPVFFVLHGFLYFFGFIAPAEAALLALFYCTGALLLYLLVWLLYRRQWQKASIVTAYLLMAYFFFGAYHDFFLRHLPVLSHYSVLLLLIVTVFAILILFLRKAKKLLQLVAWLNLLFIAYILVDIVLLMGNYIHPPAGKFSFLKEHSITYKPVPAINKPDIYFLVFDEYASSISLKENYGYRNDIDSLLVQRGFRVLPESYSNYNYTPASIASILNMNYISGLADSVLLTAKDMNECLGLIKYSQVLSFLSGQGYEIVNCSHFNLMNSPVTVNDPILPVKTGLISDNTLYSKIKRDVWGDMNRDLLLDRLPWMKNAPDQNNRQLLKMIKDQSAKKNTHPVFVFGHLYMPHDPFWYDNKNQIRDPQQRANDIASPATPYLAYLTHVNLEMKMLLDTIQQHTNRKAVIIVMGDHGFRGRDIDQNLRKNYQNLNAVYIPGKNNQLFYDSISGVNQFRVVFNTLFNQSIPLQKDSMIFLNGKE